MQYFCRKGREIENKVRHQGLLKHIGTHLGPWSWPSWLCFPQWLRDRGGGAHCCLVPGCEAAISMAQQH